jgi:hypothetical protein
MAISPNTDFSAGAVLTSAQQNRFPRGVMAFTTATASDTTITSEEVQLGLSFTAVANRYYKITYFEPALFNSGTVTATARIRLGTTIAGTLQQSSLSFAYSTYEETTCVAITTLTAGTTNFVATLQSSSGTIQATRSSTQYAFLLVEDIGPA